MWLACIFIHQIGSMTINYVRMYLISGNSRRITDLLEVKFIKNIYIKWFTKNSWGIYEISTCKWFAFAS